MIWFVLVRENNHCNKKIPYIYDLLVLVIVDNLCNNYCNISLNSTCRYFLYKRTPGHIEEEKKKRKKEAILEIKIEGKQKNLTLFSLLKKATVAAPVQGQKQANNPAPPPFWYIFCSSQASSQSPLFWPKAREPPDTTSLPPLLANNRQPLILSSFLTEPRLFPHLS